MRRYRIAYWILFSLSIINFTLTAPVAVRDVHRVPVNVVDGAKDKSRYRTAKRMDQSGDLTSEHGTSHSESSDLASEHGTSNSESSDLASEHGASYSEQSDLASEHETSHSEPSDLASEHGVSHAEPSDLASEHGVSHAEPSDLESEDRASFSGSSGLTSEHGQPYNSGSDLESEHGQPYNSGSDLESEHGGQYSDPSDPVSEYGRPYPEGLGWDGGLVPLPGPGSESGWDGGSESNLEWTSGSDSDSVSGEGAKQWEGEPSNHEPVEPSDMEVDDHEQSPLHNPEHDNGIPHSPPPQNPAASEFVHEDLSGLSKLLKGFRPRTSTSGAVDAAKREFPSQETDDTRNSMVRGVGEFLNAPATSASSVIDPGGATSQYSLPGHSPNRKKWMLDRLD